VTWVALGLVPLLAVAGLISLGPVDADGDGFDDSAVPPTIEIVEPADQSRFVVGEPIQAAFRLQGGRGMKPRFAVLSLRRGDVIHGETLATRDPDDKNAGALYRATLDKGLATPGAARLVIRVGLRPANADLIPWAKTRYTPIQIESGIDVEVTR